MVAADGDEFVQNLLLCPARSGLVAPTQRARQFNSCRMGELGVHRDLLVEDSNGDISREATKFISKISPEAMRPEQGLSSSKLAGKMVSRALARLDMTNQANEIRFIAIKARALPTLQGCRLMLSQQAPIRGVTPNRLR